MPFLFSCVSHAFFRVSTSVVSAWATLSTSGQSASSMTSHSILPSLSANGSKPFIIGLTISPGEVLMRSLRPSRCSRLSSKPQSASTRLMSRSTYRSAPFLLKTLCSCCLIVNTTSPVSASGCSSAISRKVTLCPSGEPFCMWTSRTSRSCFVLKLLPLPPQELHADCICWIMGPIRMTSTLTPRPSQSEQVTTPFFLSMTCRVMAIFLVCPLYSCSRVTFSGCMTSLVFWRLLPAPLPRRPAPLKKDSKMSDGSPPSPPSRPSSPKRSYLDRLSESLSTS
mmetsp:Transcript_21309/g.48685  ORF Transcript_21309/g.48685 Transcript_21309/m.48685 type:complete len:281 (-) Transcript_21309:289-1131(-)